MITIGRYLVSLIFWTWVGITCVLLWLVAVPVFLLTCLFDRRLRILHGFTSLWAYHYVLLCPLWRTRIEGREKISKDRPQILVANHQSLGDILVLFGLFRPYKWVSKKSIFYVPFIGWNMSMNRYVGLVRGDSDSIDRMMEDCRRHLRAGSSVLIFPEGTRSPDGRMRRFKQGAFALALETGCEVVPIAVSGTHDALPKHGFIFHQEKRVEIRVRVLDAMAALPGDSVRDLRQRVQKAIGDALQAPETVTRPGASGILRPIPEGPV